MIDLKKLFADVAIPKVQQIRDMVKANGDLIVSDYTLQQLYGGMRGVKATVSETSQLDPKEGIRFRGYSIQDIYGIIPKYGLNTSEPLPEFIFLLMLFDRIPEKGMIQALSEEWHQRSRVPKYVYTAIDSLPEDAHPMTQFTTALAALQYESQFSNAYNRGISKDEYWEYSYEDIMNLLAVLPKIVAYIYQNNYQDRKRVKSDTTLDWAGNFAHLIGDNEPSEVSLRKEFFRLYLTIHSDHEGGNNSAFTSHVVGSTLTSPYTAYMAAMGSLSGPLHGRATQGVLHWYKRMLKYFGDTPTKEQITEYVRKTLQEGSVVPGYGHAVLRITDPRFTTLMNFSKKHKLSSQFLETVWKTYEVTPDILRETHKIKNVYPNVDGHSGATLHALGYQNEAFYTVFFGMSRALGLMASLLWDRVLKTPIYRPKSVTSMWVKKHIVEAQ